MTVTATEAARSLHASLSTVRTWCRTGQLAAVKSHGRWVIRVSALARLLCPAADRPRRGQCPRQMPQRAARRCEARRAARLLASEHGTRVLGHQQRARIACANSGYLLARDYLAGIGCDEAFIGKFESAFGRKVAAVYRERHHAEPQHGGIVVLRGRLWKTMKYSDIRDLHAGAAQYARTRGLFGVVA